MKTKNIRLSSLEFWSDIDWKFVNRSVVKLRRRIFDAKQKGDLKSLCNLQKLMLNASFNVAFSIRKVSYNRGSRTPGIDGFILESPAIRLSLLKEICFVGWNGRDPKPIRRIYIQEPNKLRTIGIPTIYDRVIQTMVMNALEPEWEAIFEIGSYGFRPKRSVNDAISRLWLSLNKPNSRKWIVDTDISRCFDSISHRYLLKQIAGFPGSEIIEKMLVSGVIVREVWISSEDGGTPQGSVISPLLCNIALHGLEKELGVIYNSKGYVDRKGRSLIRFADELVILCNSRLDAISAVDNLSLSLAIRGLEIFKLKTKIVHITEGFDFLGFNIKMQPKRHISYSKSIVKIDEDNYAIVYNSNGVYVSPSDRSLRKVKANLKKVLLSCKGSTAKKFVEKLNPIIRGYVLSKRHWHSNAAFRHLDKYIYILCWRWAIRKHPQKGTGWIKDKYFKHLILGNIRNKWVFSAIGNKQKNSLLYNDIYVLKTYWFGIKDYLVAQMDRRPDNRNDATYFKDLEKRRFSSRRFNIFGNLDKSLVISQDHLCSVCGQELYNGETLHLHHIVPTSLGGETVFSNLLYLHLPCHYQAYSPHNYEEFVHRFQKYKASHPSPNFKKVRKLDEAF